MFIIIFNVINMFIVLMEVTNEYSKTYSHGKLSILQ